VALITATLPVAPLGPYQLQAAIAAIHDEAPRAEDTDRAQILGVYDLLAGTGDNPVVTLNHAVALAMVRGPEAGLATSLPERRYLDGRAARLGDAAPNPDSP
jgi:predicted RNA polymerase sigma factor